MSLVEEIICVTPSWMDGYRAPYASANDEQEWEDDNPSGVTAPGLRGMKEAGRQEYRDLKSNRRNHGKSE